MRDAVHDAALDRFSGEFALAPVTERQLALLRHLAGQRRAISRTPVPADDSRIMVARSASLRGVLCARLSRSKLSSSSEVRRIGVADSRGMREFRRIGAGFRLAPCHTGVPLTRRQTPRQAPL